MNQLYDRWLMHLFAVLIDGLWVIGTECFLQRLAPIQMGEVEAKHFPLATREEMEELWHAEEEEVMRAEFRML